MDAKNVLDYTTIIIAAMAWVPYIIKSITSRKKSDADAASVIVTASVDVIKQLKERITDLEQIVDELQEENKKLRKLVSDLQKQIKKMGQTPIDCE